MNDLQIFKSSEFGDIRVVPEANGEPLFCLNDVCRVLNIENTRNVKGRLNEKGVYTMDTPTNGGVQQMTFIDEPNLYRCIFQCRKKRMAQRFQDWVFEEVLPSIRKTGSYAVAPQPQPMTQLEALQLSVNMLVEQERRVSNIENEVRQIRQEQEEARKSLFKAELSEEHAPVMTMRARVRELVNKYASATNTPHRDVWNRVYQKLLYLYGISVNRRNDKKKLNNLDVAERDGFLGEVFNIISDMIRELNHQSGIC